MTLWVVIPAYNEAEALPKVLPGIIESAQEIDADAQVLVIDDGSTDETAALTADMANTPPSRGSTWNSREAINRVSQYEQATPATTPRAATRNPRQANSRTTFRTVAPSASRTPISRRRCATEYATTP